jgi:hypothetical protein
MVRSCRAHRAAAGVIQGVLDDLLLQSNPLHCQGVDDASYVYSLRVGMARSATTPDHDRDPPALGRPGSSDDNMRAQYDSTFADTRWASTWTSRPCWGADGQVLIVAPNAVVRGTR